MFNLRFKIFAGSILTLILTGFFLFPITIHADLEADCQWDNIERAEQTFSKENYRQLLEKCKAYYEEMTDQIGEDIDKTDQEKKTLASQISILRSKISSLNYQINQGNIMIKDLSSQIANTQGSIFETSAQVEDIKQKLVNLLQLRYEEDQRSSVEIMLAEEKLSDFFDDLVALEMLNLQTQELLQNIENLKTSLETQKSSMDVEKQDLESLVIIQTLQKQDSAQQKGQQETFLKLTELEYQKYLKEQKQVQETVQRIGSLLFELLEVPEGGIKFEDAVSIAKEISKQTGVRAAFSLAVLWQETRIGKLKGGCYLKNVSTGDGVYIRTGNKAPKSMKPTRDVKPFLSIVQSLNDVGKLQTDAFHTPVSCAMIRDGSYFGWGGAMGPAQFIASTWMLFKAEIEQKTGEAPANPWNVRDAFLANSLYLKKLGADGQTYAKEIYSALRYFGCTSAWCRSNYGEPVMRVATCLQTFINDGLMSSSCQSLVF